MNQFNLSCDFDSPGCSWANSEEGVTSWSVGQGRTPSSRTGPSADHTFNNTLGRYLYFEASWTQNTKRLQDGDRVILKSPMIVSPTICLRFAYHMYGQHIKGLEVFVKNGKHNVAEIWGSNGSLVYGRGRIGSQLGILCKRLNYLCNKFPDNFFKWF